MTKSAVAYGIMLDTFQPEDTNANLDQATDELLSSLEVQPGSATIGQDEKIPVNGIAGESVDLLGNSPYRVRAGARWEREWPVTFHRCTELVVCGPHRSDKDFQSFRPHLSTC